MLLNFVRRCRVSPAPALGSTQPCQLGVGQSAAAKVAKEIAPRTKGRPAACRARLRPPPALAVQRLTVRAKIYSSAGSISSRDVSGRLQSQVSSLRRESEASEHGRQRLCRHQRATKSAACICYNNKMVPLLYAWWPRLIQHVELLIRSHTRLRLDLNTGKYGYYSVLKLYGAKSSAAVASMAGWGAPGARVGVATRCRKEPQTTC